MQTNPKSTKLIICFVTRQIRYTDVQLNCGEQAKPSVIEGLCFVHLNLNIYTQPLIIIIVTVASENLNGLKKKSHTAQKGKSCCSVTTQKLFHHCLYFSTPFKIMQHVYNDMLINIYIYDEYHHHSLHI